MGQDPRQVLCDITRCIQSLLQGKTPPRLDLPDNKDSVVTEAVQTVNHLADCIGEIHQFVQPLSQGILDTFTPQKSNLLASPFKELHARLLQLTWQAERVAQGDYHQRIDFMGQFSTSFNAMVEKLAEREKHLTEINDELEGRINERTLLLQAANRQLQKAAHEWDRTFDAITDRILILLHWRTPKELGRN
ncbi:hypothetical protein ACFL6U_22075 [Planctomycetota bacterium]